MKTLQKIDWNFMGLLILAAVIRAVGIQSRSIQYDDAFSIILSSQSFSRIITGTAADTMPPLYYFLLHLWMGIGNSIWFLRMLSLLFSLGTLFFIYLIAKKISNMQAAYWACFLFAVSPIHFYHSQDLRMYAMLTLILAAYTYLCLVIFQEEFSWKRQVFWFVLLTIIGALAFYSHNLAGFLLLIPDLYLLLSKKFKLLISLGVSQLFSFVLFLPWLAYVPGQIDKIQSAFWTPKPGVAEIFQALIMFTSNLPLPGVLLPIGMISAAFIYVTLILWIGKSWKSQSGFLYPLIMFIYPPVILFFVSYTMRPVFVPRGFLISSIGLFLLAGIFLDSIIPIRSKSNPDRKLPKISGIVVLIAFIISSVIGLYTQFTFSGFPRSPFLGAMENISRTYQSGDCIIHDNKLSYFPSKIYRKDLPQKFLPDEPGSSNDTFAQASQLAMDTFPEKNIQSAVVGCKKIFFVVFNQAVEEYSLSTGTDHPIIQWMNSRVKFEKKILFTDLWVYEYNQ